MTAPPPVPPPQPRLRPDGAVKGPARRPSLWVLAVGVVLFVASMVVIVPAFVDGISGPRFAIPGQHTMDLEDGTWTIYQHTGTTRGGGGFTVTQDHGITITPEHVTVSGPASAEVWAHSFGSETITRGNVTYTGAVRFRVAQGGAYTIAIHGEPGGEVLIARPVSDLFGRWPWMIAGATGGILVVAGAAMWNVGATNRRVARRAGFDV